MSPRPSLPLRRRAGLNPGLTPRLIAGLTAGVAALALVAGCTGTPTPSETSGAAG